MFHDVSLSLELLGSCPVQRLAADAFNAGFTTGSLQCFTSRSSSVENQDATSLQAAAMVQSSRIPACS